MSDVDRPRFPNVYTATSHTSPEPASVAYERLPFVPYEERFERHGIWLLGPRILAKICRHMRDKCLTATRQGDELTLSLPEFPKVRDRISGREESILWVIPWDLQPYVERSVMEVVSYRTDDLDRIRAEFLYCPATDLTIARVNSRLQDMENGRLAVRNPADPPLWGCFAECFGLSPIDAAFLPDHECSRRTCQGRSADTPGQCRYHRRNVVRAAAFRVSIWCARL